MKNQKLSIVIPLYGEELVVDAELGGASAVDGRLRPLTSGARETVS